MHEPGEQAASRPGVSEKQREQDGQAHVGQQRESRLERTMSEPLPVLTHHQGQGHSIMGTCRVPATTVEEHTGEEQKVSSDKPTKEGGPGEGAGIFKSFSHSHLQTSSPQSSSSQ